jgi:hypothetical protein
VERPSNNGMHPTRDTLPVKFNQRLASEPAVTRCPLWVLRAIAHAPKGCFGT